MSAFLTSDNSRAIIASFLINNQEMIKTLMGKELFYQNYGINYLYKNLSSLNIYALAECYNLKYAEKCSKLINYDIDFSKYRDVDTGIFMIKTICFVYQCSEGVINDNKIISFLEELYNKMLQKIYDGEVKNIMNQDEVTKNWN